MFDAITATHAGGQLCEAQRDRPTLRLQDWERRLRHSMEVSWSDLPVNHPKRMVDWRR